MAASQAPLAIPRYYRTGDAYLECLLCPRHCRIPPGGTSSCLVRQNSSGAMRIPYYGYITALAVDPMEKKPLYHFRPGEQILSLGFAGCNLHCPFCQNWRISQTTEVRGDYMSPKDIIHAATSAGVRQIAYTYSEPSVHIEFLLDCMEAARAAGLANVLVSNGCIEGDAAAEVLALTDAANIDLKCFSADTYTNMLGGSLEAVLSFLQLCQKMGVHLEATTLVVPGLNDSPEELLSCAAFLAGLSPDIPWHLSAYHPDYRWDAPPTNPAALFSAARQAAETLRYVYLGNIPAAYPADDSTPLTPGFHDTRCHACMAYLVRRRGYSIDTAGLKHGTERYCRCAQCGAAVPIVS